MIHYIHVIGRQHGVTADTASRQAQLPDGTMKQGEQDLLWHYQERNAYKLIAKRPSKKVITS
jgi:hypothetical protein